MHEYPGFADWGWDGVPYINALHTHQDPRPSLSMCSLPSGLQTLSQTVSLDQAAEAPVAQAVQHGKYIYRI